MPNSMRIPNQLDLDLLNAAGSGDAKAVSLALAKGVNPAACGARALLLAAEGGHAPCVELLAHLSDVLSPYSPPLRRAAEGGHAECVKLLIDFCSEKARSDALPWAARYGSFECAALLAPWGSPNAISEALSLSAKSGHFACVELLIPFSTDARRNSLALTLAATNGHARCAALLLPASPSLLRDRQPFFLAIQHGRADVAAAMLSHEPALASNRTLESCLSSAIRAQHGDLAGLLRSIIEKRALCVQDASVFIPSRASSPRL